MTPTCGCRHLRAMTEAEARRYRENEQRARGRARAASSDNLRAIYNRVAERYAKLAEHLEQEG